MGTQKNIILHYFFQLLTQLIVVICVSKSAAATSFNDSFTNSAKIAKPAVVSILVYNKIQKKNDPVLRKVGYGSGTIYKKKYIITNYHVVKKGNYYQVLNSDGLKISLRSFDKGNYYLADPKTDIAILLIDQPDDIHVRSIEFEDSDDLQEGEWVLAIGNPYSLGLSVTAGIVSSKGRDNIGFADIEDFIQTDASINPGNSGGPLLNLDGKCIGINTAIHSLSGGFQGISFAIPSNIVKRVCYDLIKYGHVKRGWLGFIAREMNEKGIQKRDVEIISIVKDSPAAEAGLKKGDVLRSIDNEEIHSLGTLVKIIGNKHIGETVPIIIKRKGRTLRFVIKLQERKEYRETKKILARIFDDYGIELEESSDEASIIVSYVNPIGIKNNIKKGDIIKAINNVEISSLGDLIKVYAHRDYKIHSMKIIRDSTRIHIMFGTAFDE